MMHDLVKKTRTVRRFDESRPLDRDALTGLADITRFGGSARNGQPLRYMIVTDRETRELIFPHLGWAGYLTDWPGPAPGERPTAYVLCLLVKDRCKGPEHEAHFDLGISTQNFLLAAAEQGIFGCRIGSFSSSLSREMKIDGGHKLLLVLALGYPAEQVILEKIDGNGSVRYWRDEQGVHHVPKRSLEDILYVPAADK